MFSELEESLQKELLEFVENEKDKSPKPLRDVFLCELLRQMVNNERMISGLATNQKTGDVFVRFSFTGDVQGEQV